MTIDGIYQFKFLLSALRLCLDTTYTVVSEETGKEETKGYWWIF